MPQPSSWQEPRRYAPAVAGSQSSQKDAKMSPSARLLEAWKPANVEAFMVVVFYSPPHVFRSVLQPGQESTLYIRTDRAVSGTWHLSTMDGRMRGTLWAKTLRLAMIKRHMEQLNSPQDIETHRPATPLPNTGQRRRSRRDASLYALMWFPSKPIYLSLVVSCVACFSLDKQKPLQPFHTTAELTARIDPPTETYAVNYINHGNP